MPEDKSDLRATKSIRKKGQTSRESLFDDIIHLYYQTTLPLNGMFFPMLITSSGLTSSIYYVLFEGISEQYHQDFSLKRTGEEKQRSLTVTRAETERHARDGVTETKLNARGTGSLGAREGPDCNFTDAVE